MTKLIIVISLKNSIIWRTLLTFFSIMDILGYELNHVLTYMNENESEQVFLTYSIDHLNIEATHLY